MAIVSFFRRGRSADETEALLGLAKRGSLEEFLAAYRDSDAGDPELGPRLLADALANRDPATRVAIGNRLLDDGADASWSSPHGSTMAHILLGQVKHDVAGEAPLLQRLLDGGADINRVVPKHGTPLELIVDQFNLSEADLAPIYDVVFARPDLDLLQTSLYDNSVLTNFRKAAQLRPDLVARAEAYLTDHGVAVPPA